MSLKSSACVQDHCRAALRTADIFNSKFFVSWKCSSSFHFRSTRSFFVSVCEHLSVPPRRHVFPAWQRFNFTVLRTPSQGFNPDALPAVFKSQHSCSEVVAQGDSCDNNMDYQDTYGVNARMRVSRHYTYSRSRLFSPILRFATSQFCLCKIIQNSYNCD